MQVRRSGIRDAIEAKKQLPCKIYSVDVMNTGKFIALNTVKVPDDPKVHDEFWQNISTHEVSQWGLPHYRRFHWDFSVRQEFVFDRFA